MCVSYFSPHIYMEEQMGLLGRVAAGETCRTDLRKQPESCTQRLEVGCGTHWSADQGVWPTGGPHHRPLAFKCSFMAASLSRFTKLPCCKRRLKTHLLLPLNMRGGLEQDTHISHLTSHPSLGAWESFLGAQAAQEVRRSRERVRRSRGSVGPVGTLLCLYLDGCLSICKLLVCKYSWLFQFHNYISIQLVV